MKNLILAIACCISSTSFAQFKITDGSITVQSGAIFTIDSLTQSLLNAPIGGVSVLYLLLIV